MDKNLAIQPKITSVLLQPFNLIFHISHGKLLLLSFFEITFVGVEQIDLRIWKTQ